MHSTNRTLAPLRFTSLMFALVGLAGCDPDGEFEDAAFEDEEELRDEVVQLEPTGCSEDRQIVRLLDQGACPAVAGWTGKKLFFTGGDNGVGELAEFCSYEFASAGQPTPAQVSAFDAHLGTRIADYDADCELFVAQSREPLEGILAPTLHQMFGAGIGGIDLADLTGAPAPAPVTVVVIDTSVAAPPEPYFPHSPHGETMVDIIESIACPSSACTVDVQRLLGLPRVNGGALGGVRGGYFGSYGDVATAIRNAADIATPHRIINLSIGTDPAFGDETDLVGVAAIKAAIEYASCKGSLIIAAAGNDVGLGTTGPLLPAIWEEEQAPGQGRCSDAFDISIPAPPPGYRPLVHSVGGLRYDNEWMPGTRVDGKPCIAAPASHVSVEAGQPTTTGTSVSAATVSGAAALIWSYFPNLSAAKVMERIHSTGYDLAVPADYWLVNQANPGIRRVDVCRALKQGASLPGSGWTSLPSCAAAVGDVAAAGETTLRSQIGNLTNLQGIIRIANNLADTDGDHVYSSVPALDVWPASQPIKSYTQPQPSQPACPNCTIKKGTTKLTAILDPSYVGANDIDVFVEVSDGVSSTIYRLGDPNLSTSVVTEIDLRFLPPVIRWATISIAFDQLDGIAFPRPQVNQLLVVD